MTEEELDRRINEQMDRERMQNAILKFEIENLKNAVAEVEQNQGNIH